MDGSLPEQVLGGDNNPMSMVAGSLFLNEHYAQMVHQNHFMNPNPQSEQPQNYVLASQHAAAQMAAHVHNHQVQAEQQQQQQLQQQEEQTNGHNEDPNDDENDDDQQDVDGDEDDDEDNGDDLNSSKDKDEHEDNLVQEQDSQCSDVAQVKSEVDVIMRESEEVIEGLDSQVFICAICKSVLDDTIEENILDVYDTSTSRSSSKLADVLIDLIDKTPDDNIKFLNTSICPGCFSLLDRADELQEQAKDIQDELTQIKSSMKESLNVATTIGTDNGGGSKQSRNFSWVQEIEKNPYAFTGTRRKTRKRKRGRPKLVVSSEEDDDKIKLKVKVKPLKPKRERKSSMPRKVYTPVYRRDQAVPPQIINKDEYRIKYVPKLNLATSLSAGGGSSKANSLLKRKRGPKTYNSEAVHSAIEAVTKGEISVRKAAVEFNIPRSTLNDKLSGKTPVDAGRVGPPAMLTDQEEEYLVEHIKSSSRRALPVTRASILNDVMELLQGEIQRGVQRRLPPHMTSLRPSRSWWNLFKKRHPGLPYHAGHAGSGETGRAAVERWFWYAQTYFVEHGQLSILSDPSRMFTVDEVLSHGPDDQNLSVLSVVGADGRLPPPCIIFPGPKVEYLVVAALPPADQLNCTVAHSANGHTDREVLIEYLSGTFHKWLERNQVRRPIVIWTEWHETRLNFRLAQRLGELGIILFGLPPKTSQVLKPTEVALRRPLREAWRATMDRWQREHPERKLGVVDFAPTFLPTYYSCMAPDLILRGFRACGLHPFDYSAPDYSRLEPRNPHKRPEQPSVWCTSGKSYQIM